MTIFLNADLRPISYRYVRRYNPCGLTICPSLRSSLHNQAVLARASGKTVTAWTSTVRRASARICSRLSSSHLTTPAASLCAAASSHSIFADLRHCELRFRAASSRSASDCLEHSIRYSRDGRAGSFTLRAFPNLPCESLFACAPLGK